MRFTDKAAAASLQVPSGLSPALIGKVVTVQTFKKDNGNLLPETLIKHVGVLMTYTLDLNGVHFVLDGGKVTSAYHKNYHVEFILYEGS